MNPIAGILTYPLPTLLINSPLSPFWTLLSIGYFIGLGLIAYVGMIYLVPYIRSKGTANPEYLTVRTTRNPLVYFFSSGHNIRPFSFKPDHLVEVKLSHPQHKHWWTFWLIARGSCYIVLGGVAFILVFANAWVSPVTLKGLEYDLFFARSNGQPDGAHLSTYLPLPFFGLYVAWKYHDEFLAILSVAFLVAVHELIWIVFYYINYYQYLNWSQWTNVSKDLAFVVMSLMFVYAFTRYPNNPIMKLRVGLINSILVYATYIFVWSLFGLPITIINNSSYGQTVWNVTQWWGNPYVNAVEVASWWLIVALFTFIVYRDTEQRRIEKLLSQSGARSD